MSTAQKTLQPDTKINPLAMTVTEAARILSAVGVGRITEQVLKRHMANGAPTDADGRINLIHYAGWLNQELNREANHGAGL